MVMPKYVWAGGASHLLYWMIRDYMNHENPNTDYPKFYQHEISTGIVSTVAGLSYFGLSGLTPAFAGIMTLIYGPLIWSISLIANRRNTNGFGHQFYTNSTTRADIERIRMEDQVEIMGKSMWSEEGFGFSSDRNQTFMSN